MKCTRIEFGSVNTDEYSWQDFCRQYQRVQAGRIDDNQVFGDLPDIRQTNADDYILVWYYADLYSRKAGALFECDTLFAEVDNSDQRFLFSAGTAFSDTVPPFGKQICARSVYVYRGGLTDDELKALLQSAKLTVHYKYKDELQMITIAANDAVVRHFERSDE